MNRRSAGSGQSMIEYLVLCTIVVALIAVPIDGSDSALALLLDAVRTAWQKFLAAVSLPV